MEDVIKLIFYVNLALNKDISIHFMMNHQFIVIIFHLKIISSYKLLFYYTNTVLNNCNFIFTCCPKTKSLFN